MEKRELVSSGPGVPNSPSATLTLRFLAACASTIVA